MRNQRFFLLIYCKKKKYIFFFSVLDLLPVSSLFVNISPQVSFTNFSDLYVAFSYFQK